MADSTSRGDRVRLSVLDRLVDAHPRHDTESPPRRTASVEELRQLIQRDLEWLLGTRWKAQDRGTGPHGRTVVEYGLEDFAPFSPSDQRATRRMARAIREAIEAYEPRLQDVTVTVDAAPHTPGAAKATVRALLVVGDVREPVAFPFEVPTRG